MYVFVKNQQDYLRIIINSYLQLILRFHFFFFFFWGGGGGVPLIQLTLVNPNTYVHMSQSTLFISKNTV